MKQLLLIPLSITDLFSQFAAFLMAAQSTRRWTQVLYMLEVLQPMLPLDGGCAEYNRQLRALIVAIPGAREGLRKALYRDLHGPAFSEDMPGRGHIFDRESALLVMDFLRDRPLQAWFREPVPQGRMYQGTALDNQQLMN